VLELARVSAGYGAFRALFDIDMAVRAGEAVGVIGPNGAGKTTLLRVISGLIRPQSGSITFDGQRTGGLPAHQVVAAGIAHVPENRRLFPRLSVEENLKIGAFLPAARAELPSRLASMYDLFPPLKARRHQLAGTLSGGEQQMCAIARGLMARPKILILDELSLGLAPIILDVLVDTIQKIHREGTTIFLVEQDVATAFDVATTGYVLENGRIVLSGPTAELKANPHVKKAYLGL
jgi:branched-chain amino acid transport system ATP-binding protein